MPKKTKKEKIIAAYRKRLKLLEEQQTFTSKPLAEEQPKKEEKITISQVQPDLTKEDMTISHYFRSDLKKSLILIGFIIALEIFLYFATIKHYLGFFS